MKTSCSTPRIGHASETATISGLGEGSTRLESLRAARATTYAALVVASDAASALRQRLKADDPDRIEAEARVDATRKTWDAAVVAYVDAFLADGVEAPPRRPARVVPPSAQVELLPIGGEP